MSFRGLGALLTSARLCIIVVKEIHLLVPGGEDQLVLNHGVLVTILVTVILWVTSAFTISPVHGTGNKFFLLVDLLFALNLFEGLDLLAVLDVD